MWRSDIVHHHNDPSQRAVCQKQRQNARKQTKVRFSKSNAPLEAGPFLEQAELLCSEKVNVQSLWHADWIKLVPQVQQS